MTKHEFLPIVEEVYKRITDYYGYSNYKNTFPYVGVEDSPFADAKVSPDTYGEYCWMFNEIVLYYKNITSMELLIRTLVHEYTHYLQSPSWMARYYKMGYTYLTHPYEVAAFNEEERWREFL